MYDPGPTTEDLVFPSRTGKEQQSGGVPQIGPGARFAVLPHRRVLPIVPRLPEVMIMGVKHARPGKKRYAEKVGVSRFAKERTPLCASCVVKKEHRRFPPSRTAAAAAAAAADGPTAVHQYSKCKGPVLRGEKTPRYKAQEIHLHDKKALELLPWRRASDHGRRDGRSSARRFRGDGPTAHGHALGGGLLLLLLGGVDFLAQGGEADPGAFDHWRS